MFDGMIDLFWQFDAITALVFNDFASEDVGFSPRFATLGEKRIFFWDLRFFWGKKVSVWNLDKEIGDCNKHASVSMASGLYLGPITLFTGSYEGKMYLWNKTKLQRIQDAHSGPIFDMKLNVRHQSFITCSSDGLIKIWSTVPGGSTETIWKHLNVTAVIAHISVMDDSRQSMGYLMLKPDENLGQVRAIMEGSQLSGHFIDKRIRQLARDCPEFLFVTDRGQNLVRKKNESAVLARDLKSEICLVVGQDRINVMIDSESVTDIDKLVTKPDDIIDQRQLRVKAFENCHCEIRSVDWVDGSIVFGTSDSMLFWIDTLKGRRSPESFSDVIRSPDVSSMCTNPMSTHFYTACADGVLQIWDQKSSSCTHSRTLGVRVVAMDISPDGYYLMAATESCCIALQASNLVVLHKIHYRPHRMTSISVIKFSPNGQYFAVGTKEGRVDFFDVHGRSSLVSWASKILQFELDAGGLEVDFSDGVLLCKMLESVLSRFVDGRAISVLKSYSIIVERPPSVHAWKNRPKSYAQKVSLMSDGLQFASSAVSHAKTYFETELLKLDGALRGRETMDSREAIKLLLAQRVSMIQDDFPRFYSAGLVGNDKPVDKWNLFKFLHFIRALDISLLEEQRFTIQECISTKVELENRTFQIKNAEKDVKKNQDLIDETKRRVHIATVQKNVLTAQMLKNELNVQEQEQVEREDRLDHLKSAVARAQKKFDDLNYKLERSKEDIFIFMGTGTGPKPHTKPITMIDWSLKGMEVQTASMGSGELKFWRTDTFEQLWPENVASTEWCTHSSALGWAVKGFTRFESLGDQHFTKFNRGPIWSQNSNVLGIGDKSGRVLLTKFPFPFLETDIDLHMETSFVSRFGYDRVSVEVELELLSELALLLRAAQCRISLVRQTSPSTFTVHIGPPVCSEDMRSAFELAVAARERVEAGKLTKMFQINYGLLGHCESIQVPAIVTKIGHTSPVFAVAFDWSGQKLLSVGENDGAICVWRILQPENNDKGRRIHDNVRTRLEERIRQAIQILRLGDGKSLEEALINCLYEWDVAKSGVVPPGIDPVVKLVMGFKTVEIILELERRGIKVLGLSERDELAARLCTAMTTPETMTVQEIKRELREVHVPTNDVFERGMLIDLLSEVRARGTEFPRPIPFEFERTAPAHARIIASVQARGETARTTVNGNKDRGKYLLEILDSICGLDMHEAQEMGVDQLLYGLIALIKSNRIELSEMCMSKNIYKDSMRRGIDLNSIETKEPEDIDWIIGGQPPAINEANLKRGGSLYEAAVKATCGTLLTKARFRFQDVPGRDFEYIRYDERGSFLDRLTECFQNEQTCSEQQPTRVSGLKAVRWGIRFYAKAVLNTIKAQMVPLQEEMDTARKLLPTAFSYQVPIGIPRLYNRRLASTDQMEDLFSSLDTTRTGSVHIGIFEQVVQKELRQCELLGLPVQSVKDAGVIKELIFCRGKFDQTSFMSEEEMGIKNELRATDIVDFLLPSTNVLGHLVFKVRVRKLRGELKIGFVDVYRIPQEVGLGVDWCWKGHPAWFLDSKGNLYQTGEKVEETDTKIFEDDVVVADLDQNMVHCL
jgi:WD40 repeat protein